MDIGQTGAVSGFFTGLWYVLRVAERRLDRGRNGPLHTRVQGLEDRIEEISLNVDQLKEEDIKFRLERLERFMREVRRNAEIH